MVWDKTLEGMASGKKTAFARASHMFMLRRKEELGSAPQKANSSFSRTRIGTNKSGNTL
jgi:hypothetical protein